MRLKSYLFFIDKNGVINLAQDRAQSRPKGDSVKFV